MASRGMSQTLGAHACFGSVDFLITTNGGLARPPAPVRSPCFIDIDTVTKALEEP
jgi:hypothetical protein